MAATLQERLLTFLAVNAHRPICQQCLADSLEAPKRDVRAVLKLLLFAGVSVAVRRGPCDRCRTVMAVVTLKG